MLVTSSNPSATDTNVKKKIFRLLFFYVRKLINWIKDKTPYTVGPEIFG